MPSIYSPSLILVVLLLFHLPSSAQEVDVRDMHSVEEYALSLYNQGEYRQAQQLLEEVARRGESRSMRDRARYNWALSSYQQGELSQALETLESMEQPNAQSVRNAQYIKKEIELRRKNASSAPPKSEEQDQQGQGESSSPEEGGSPQDSQQEQQEPSQPSEAQDSAPSQEESSNEQGEQSGEEPQNGSPAGGGIPQEAVSPEEWNKREAERILDSVEEGEHRGFGANGEGESGTKTW